MAEGRALCTEMFNRKIRKESFEGYRTCTLRGIQVITATSRNGDNKNGDTSKR